MSVKADATEQVRFLVHCIGNAQNGRPDFNAVATEMGIVSKAAAQKRYERLLKQYNITRKPNLASATTNGDSDSTPKKASPKKRAAPAGVNGSPTKKRAGRGVKKEETDEDEDKPPKTRSPRAAAQKAEATSGDSSEEKPVKDEREESPLSGETGIWKLRCVLVGYDLLSALAANIGDTHDILPNRKFGLLFLLFIY
ncbi:unnamed protein product [Clonostachys byssicola]|uniref:Myb-like DNA-binding domain-containing protein n=1 Tax=Clonostachys byssicola TaxID=160290 RepID=A0A9N9U702_9HYPO|nr:unnamed protein product [Clonostachys byssicola]